MMALTTKKLTWLALVGCYLAVGSASQLDAKIDADRIRLLSPQVFSDKQRQELSRAVGRRIVTARKRANQRDRQEWATLTSKVQWEAYRNARIARLRKSLGRTERDDRQVPTSRVTKTIRGDGFAIDNLVFESRPGMWVTANLYRPLQAKRKMPVILIAHSHHRWKTQGELQDMGMTWARAGCLVLAIDLYGYGERRLHPFRRDDKFAGGYRWSRQDYYHRYDNAVHLKLLGDSLMSWFVWDLRRGLDVVLAKVGADASRVIILGGVAGGGDPAAVTAALDERISACVPFNFGGPQPETQYPLPTDAATSFNYVGGSYWDMTRGLARSAADGFHQWLVVASIAPRRLIHAHEFSWDRQRDPVWKRYQKIYGDFYQQPEHLSYAHGKGLLRGPSAKASHCTTIGRFHRQLIHSAFKRWFQIDADEYSQRVPESSLLCWNDRARQSLKAVSPLKALERLAEQRAKSATAKESSDDEWKERLRYHLGVLPVAIASVQAAEPRSVVGVGRVERIQIRTGYGTSIGALLISPPGKAAQPRPVAVLVARAGKSAFLTKRTAEIAELLKRDFICCLVDLTAAGELAAGRSRGRTSSAANLSANLMMFGETVLGIQLSDLRCLLEYLRQRPDVNAKKLGIWGDSFSRPNSSVEAGKLVPHGIDGGPRSAEPMGGLLALLVGLLDEVQSIYVHQGLASYRSVLASPRVLIPHDAILPAAVDLGDIGGLVRRQSVPLRMEAMVDGQHQQLSKEIARAMLFGASQPPHRVSVGAARTSPARWLFAESP